MNLDSLSFALSQITYSVANLSKRTFKAHVNEISNLCSQYGSEAERHLIRCLFSHIDFSSDGRSAGKDFYQTQYLVQEFASLICKPNFVSTLCFAIDNPLHQQKSLRPSANLFSQISKQLKLTFVQEVALGLATLRSANAETRKFASQFLKVKLPQLLSSYIKSETSGSNEGGLRDAPTELLHLILCHLQVDANREATGVSVSQKEAFVKALKGGFPQDLVPVVLTPFVYIDSCELPLNKLFLDNSVSLTTMGGSLADMLYEIGYSFTKSKEQCRNTIMQFGVKMLTPANVAKVLGVMTRIPSGYLDPMTGQNPFSTSGSWSEMKDSGEGGQSVSWNVDIFISSVKELVPNLPWIEVMKELDHPGFFVNGKPGLELLIHALMSVFENFPIEHLYTLWKNREAQFSWITSAIKFTDVFCLADLPHRAVQIECLKAMPDDENRDIIIWKSMDLVDILLQYSDQGYYAQVKEIFKYPMTHCPDLLLLNLLQLPLWNNMKKEVITNLIPIFLGNHPNAVTVMQFAWHIQGNQSQFIRPMILGSMADWYMRDVHDQGRLARVLDVAQDLKALSILLNGTPFAFVIDLACLASRREYLKLDKWITDKVREHGDRFLDACVQFLSIRCPYLVGGSVKEDQLPLQAKSQQLPPETVNTMLNCLQTYVGRGNFSPETMETIRVMINNVNVLKAKQQQQQAVMPGPVVGPLGPRSGMPGVLPGLPAAMTNPMDPLSNISALGLNAVALAAASGNTGVNVTAMNAHSQFPASSLSIPPGSPAKSFPALGQNLGQLSQQTQQAGYGNVQGLTSQLQGLNLHSAMTNGLASGLGAGIGGSIGTGLGTGFANMMGNRGAPSLGALSTQVALSQQPRMEGMRPAASQPNEMNNMFPTQPASQQFSKDVEDEANSYFQRIYNNNGNNMMAAMSVEEALELLKNFKGSANPRENEVFSCMLRNLFEEYRFFAQYPDKELQTTAILFGGIIEQGLVTYMALGIALRYVLEALKKPQGGKMYMFGLTALDRFKTRLREYPQYCQFLASIAHFQDFPPVLKEYIEYGSRSADVPDVPHPAAASSAPTTTASAPVPPPAAPTPAAATTAPAPAAQPTHGAISRPATSSVRSSIANATNIDTLLANQEGVDGIVVPPETLQDKVFFIFNNLSQANMDQKAIEMTDQLDDEYMPWVAQYMVMKRASIEHNFHTLYSNFIEHLKKPDFLKMVITETYRNIKVLLRSDKGVANFSDRTLLKNLGHWLGMLMLAKNKPVLHVDIDLKSLIYEAYHKGADELLYVVPFVAKIIESAIKSRVFKPPNPWTMALMNVLSELHSEQDLKLNLKFEIEVLCKNLLIDINDLEPGNYLKDTSRLQTLEHQLSAPSKQKVMESTATPVPEEILEINMPTPQTVMMVSQPPASVVPTTMAPVDAPQLPQFGYHEINTLTLAGLSQHVVINEAITLFHTNPQMKALVRPAIERAVQELLTPAIERAITISLKTSEMIVKKDFALDPDENRLRTAAHNLLRFMTAGMALITCHEPVLISINNNLKSMFLTAMRGATQQQKDLIEQAAQIVAQDNTELATVFLQKTAIEKAIPEMDKRLTSEYENRKIARQEGRRYIDQAVMAYQERMPEEIRLKVGGVSSHQLTVYDEFTRNIPGFLPAIPEPNFQGQQSQALGAEEIFQMYEKIGRDIEQHLASFMNSPLMQPLRTLLEYVVLARNSVRDINGALALLQRAVEGLLDGMLAAPNCEPEHLMRYRDCHLMVLKYLQDPRVYGPQWTNKQVTRCLIECREEYKYNAEAAQFLIHNQLVIVPQLDAHLSQLVESGVNYMAVAFAMQLVQHFCIDTDKHGRLQEGDFTGTIEALSRIAMHSRNAPEGLTTLLEAIRQHNGDIGLLDRTNIAPTSMMHSGITQAREFDDPPGLHEKTEFLLREWVSLYHQPTAGRDSTKAFSSFVAQMHIHGILKTDDLITRFFRLCTEMCVDLCYRALTEPNQNTTRVRVQCFHTLDAFVRLIVLLLKHSGDTSNTVTKINLLNKVLGIVAGVLLQDHEVRRTEFHQLPYHRIFIMLFIELNSPEPVLEAINFDILQAFCNTLHILRPSKAPGFSYAWLELVSHRVFIGRMLALTPQQKAWGMYAQLLVDLFKFLAPFLRNAEMSKPTQLLYKGTMRVLLVLLHDFPELLCDYHYAFCDVIPSNCIQVRNLILSAFPRSMRLPDPFTPNLKVDILPEIANAPRIMSNFVAMIHPPQLKKDLDSYLKTRSPVTFLSELRSKLQLSNQPGMKYNIPLMNSLVLHVGTQAIAFIHAKGLTPSMSTIAHSSHMDIFQNLVVDLDTEGRYLFLNAMVNQLRYPNSHTHYFSCTLLYLFVEANSEVIQEQITRVLLERLIVNRPHPWGLLITFIELIRNPQYKFWNHEFVHCAPEIEKLLDSVARSCLLPKQNLRDMEGSDAR